MQRPEEERKLDIAFEPLRFSHTGFGLWPSHLPHVEAPVLDLRRSTNQEAEARAAKRSRTGPFARMCLGIADKIWNLESKRKEMNQTADSIYTQGMRLFYTDGTAAGTVQRASMLQDEVQFRNRARGYTDMVVALCVLLKKYQALDSLFSTTKLPENVVHLIGTFAYDLSLIAPTSLQRWEAGDL